MTNRRFAYIRTYEELLEAQRGVKRALNRNSYSGNRFNSPIFKNLIVVAFTILRKIL